MNKLQIYLRNDKTSLEITGSEGIITLESRAMLNGVPPQIDTWGCKYRRMSDGRCFVVMRTFVPTSFLCDLLWGETNKEAQNQLASYIAFEKFMNDKNRKEEK
jgi:hypothetical protein